MRIKAYYRVTPRPSVRKGKCLFRPGSARPRKGKDLPYSHGPQWDLPMDDVETHRG